MKKRFVIVSILIVLFLTIFTGCGKKCSNCGGTGVCTMCDGDGTFPTNSFVCVTCDGTGKCFLCEK